MKLHISVNPSITCSMIRMWAALHYVPSDFVSSIPGKAEVTIERLSPINSVHIHLNKLPETQHVVQSYKDDRKQKEEKEE